MNKLKCFEAWAGQTFLGYEYAEDPAAAIVKTHEKFDSPKVWGVERYHVKQLTLEA